MNTAENANAPFQLGEEHFRAMVENATDIVSLLAQDGTVLYESPSIERLLGYKPEELVGRNCAEILHPDDVALAMEHLRDSVLAPELDRTMEFRCRRKDGSWCCFEGIGRSFRSESGVTAIVVHSRDISERKRAEEATLAAREAAERANRAKSEFVSRMSHELRTPMNSILGFAQVLARKSLSPDQHKHVEHILKAGHHLLKLINEVLDISRIDANRIELSTAPVRVALIVQETLNLVEPLAAQHACTIVDEVSSGEDFYVSGDRQRLVQVLLNLVSNAVKYNREGGSVRVGCQRPSVSRLRIQVIDTGSGISSEAMPLLFSPFERLGADRTDVEGTGLGLALSQRLAEAMGGELGVESRVGEGSTFWLELDLLDPSASAHVSV
jgi:PAS domain S-box-containing protein